MAYTVPTVDDFLERFPIFEDKDEDQIQRCIDEASRSVDDCWVPEDAVAGILYLAAHLLVNDASQEGDVIVTGPQSGGVSSESFGGMSVSYNSGQTDNLSSSGEFGNTTYGRSYLRLLRINKPPIVVI